MHVKLVTSSGNYIVGDDTSTFLIKGLKPCDTFGQPKGAKHAFKFRSITVCNGQNEDGEFIYGDETPFFKIAQGQSFISKDTLHKIMAALDKFALQSTSKASL